MKKLQRILAGAGALLLLAMYGSTLVFALSGSPQAEDWLMASLYCTIVVPVLLYAYTLIYRYLKNRNHQGPSDSQDTLTDEKGGHHD